MALLIVFAFVAGAGTAVSPCVLPVLPVVLSAGATGGRQRPLGIVTGLALSFTFATVALVYLIDALGLPSGLPRTIAIVVLIGFGISLMLPPVLVAQIEAQDQPRHVALRAAQRRGRRLGVGALDRGQPGLRLRALRRPDPGRRDHGIGRPELRGGPGRLAVALAYGIGSAVVLYALALGGRRLTSRLSRRSLALQVAIRGRSWSRSASRCSAISTLALRPRSPTTFPPFWSTRPATSRTTGGTKSPDRERCVGGSGIPTSPRTRRGRSRRIGAKPCRCSDGRPELVGTQQWFNTPDDRPLSLRGLRGKVEVIDFWTYSCINCIRTLPYLNSWYRPLPIEGVRDRRRPYAGVPIRAQRLERPGERSTRTGSTTRWSRTTTLRPGAPTARVLAGRISDRRPGPRPSRRVRRGQLRGQGERRSAPCWPSGGPSA